MAVVSGALWGATEVLRRVVRNGKKKGKNGQERGINFGTTPSGLMDTAYWQDQIKSIVHDELRVVSADLQRIVEDLGKILGMIDPSGHTPRGGRRSQRD